MTLSESEYIKLFGSLNQKQIDALTTTYDSVLQVVAGPGTGKTKLLISRVAYLLLNFNIPPSSIIVTTFTKKAAIEMRDRLQGIMEHYDGVNLYRLQIGTFHSICFGYLRYYGRYVGLKNFNIAEEKDQKELMKKAIEALSLDDVKTDKQTIGYVRSFIARQKSAGLHPDDVTITDPEDKLGPQYLQVYHLYQSLLKQNSLIDFDDILVYTYKLLKVKPDCVSYVKHILVDEFQDTNTIQLNLLFEMSRYCQDNITIVGDADQSIYAFRNATYENFAAVERIAQERRRKFVKVTLDQNYRSTKAILRIAECLMRNQERREDKNLVSNNPRTSPVYFIQHDDPEDEPRFIASKIQEVLELNDNNYKYRDCAVIVRASRTFISIERELTRLGIPYKIIKGHSFWDLKEISMAVDCLRVVANDDWLSYKRILGWYVEGCGDKLIAKIESALITSETGEIPEGAAFRILTAFATGEQRGATSKVKVALLNLLSLVDQCRIKVKDESRRNFFHFVRDKFSLVENAFKKKSSKKKTDEELKLDIQDNLYELQDQFEKYDPDEDEVLRRAQEEVFEEQEKLLSTNTNQEEESEQEDSDSENEDTAQKEKTDIERLNFLSTFLDHIFLAETMATDDNIETESGRVTLTTIHGSKGLEWPVVLLPSLINGLLPSKYSLNESDPLEREKSIDEERRCLYVAVTRGKDYLYLSTFARSIQGFYGTIETTPSMFFDEIPKDCYFDIGGDNPPCTPIPSSNIVPNKPVITSNQPTSKNNIHTKGIKIEKPLLVSFKQKNTMKVVGINGKTYNPVTGSIIDVDGTISRKKRLGMRKANPKNPFLSRGGK